MSRTPGPINYAGSTVLITGASSGLGAEFARQLARRGAHLVLVARREDRLQSIAEEISSPGCDFTVTVLAADLSLPGAGAALVDALSERDIRIGSLINNAGFGLAGRFAETDPDRLEQLIAVNVTALTELSRLLLPQLLEQNRGALINIASTVAHMPVPNMAAYAASKAFVLSLTEAIAYETRRSALRVLALSPGPTRTAFFEVADAELAVGPFQTPEQVVTLALATLDRRHRRSSVVSGFSNKATALLGRYAPRRLTLAAGARALRHR